MPSVVEKRRVARQDAEVPLDPGRDDLVRGLRNDQTHRRGDLERQPVGH